MASGLFDDGRYFFRDVSCNSLTFGLKSRSRLREALIGAKWVSENDPFSIPSDLHFWSSRVRRLDISSGRPLPESKNYRFCQKVKMELSCTRGARFQTKIVPFLVDDHLGWSSRLRAVHFSKLTEKLRNRPKLKNVLLVHARRSFSKDHLPFYVLRLFCNRPRWSSRLRAVRFSNICQKCNNGQTSKTGRTRPPKPPRAPQRRPRPP